MKKRKKFWIFLVIVGLIYLGLFFFIKSQISGAFAVETKESIYFDDLPGAIQLPRNQQFVLDVDYLDCYVFSDNSDLFDINETTGVISFVPRETGEFPVVIIALKDLENYEVKVVIFNVGL